MSVKCKRIDYDYIDSSFHKLMDCLTSSGLLSHIGSPKHIAKAFVDFGKLIHWACLTSHFYE